MKLSLSLQPARIHCLARHMPCLLRNIHLVKKIMTEEQRDAVEAYIKEIESKERFGTHRFGERKNGRIYWRLCHQSGERRKNADLDRRLCA